jgi:hypothetical protein
MNTPTVRRWWLTLALTLLTGAACDRSGTTGPDAAFEPITDPRALVTPTHATFGFPVAQRAEWEWNLGGEADGLLEYGWNVYVPRESRPHYSFGFSRFRFSDELERGTLADLLAAGQRTVWEVDGLSGRAIPGKVHVRVADGGILIELTDPNLIAQLFGAGPPEVFFEVIVPGTPMQRTRVAVEYRAR